MSVPSGATVAVQEQRWPVRFTVVILMFLSVVMLYLDRVNISNGKYKEE